MANSKKHIDILKDNCKSFNVDYESIDINVRNVILHSMYEAVNQLIESRLKELDQRVEDIKNNQS